MLCPLFYGVIMRLLDFSVLSIRGAADDFLEKRYAYNGSDLQYEGWTYKPNASTSAEVWYIVKYTVAGGVVTRQQLPDHGPSFQYSWDDRATYFS